MHRSLRFAALAALAVGATSFVACDDDGGTSPNQLATYSIARLVSNTPAYGGVTTDANLVNPWGLAIGPTGVLWIANNGTGTASLYGANGAAQGAAITVPGAAGVQGTPTGLVANSTIDFPIGASGPAEFILCGEDGTIAAWNATLTAAQVVVDRSATGAVYKGLAIATNSAANFLYATNFKTGTVDVFNRAFQIVSSFADPTIPVGFAPFGIHNIGGQLFVTYAKQLPPDNEDDDPGVGNGYVVVFNPDGTVSSRFATTGTLNSPWAVAVAPLSGFGIFSGAILVGNFGDGLIGAYSTTGTFLGLLRDQTGQPLAIDGLWALNFGPAPNTSTLFYTAGPADETGGVLGTIVVR